MTKKEDKSSPAPTDHKGNEKYENQSTEVKRSKSNINIILFIIVAIIVIAVILAFAGWL